MGTELGNNIERALKENGMTQKQLAENSGVTEASISHYIKGDREPRGKTINVLASVLGVTAGFLLGYGTKSLIESQKQQKFEEIKRLIVENKNSFTSEEKIEIIKLLSI